LELLTTRAVALAQEYGASVLLNGDESVARRLHAHGVHLTSERLMGLAKRPELPLVGASCHDEWQLARAAQLGLDFVVLGPVCETATHPGSTMLGWQRFSQLTADYPLPVFAIGGLRKNDLEIAWRAGAHGIAAIRATWKPQ
jgi:8-oxo-dGTP diphosphatase